jgi:hypothetical protein
MQGKKVWTKSLSQIAPHQHGQETGFRVLPKIPAGNAGNRLYKGKTWNREEERAIAERPRNVISTGNSRELKRCSRTRKCRTQELVLSLSKEKGESGEENPKNLLFFPLPVFPSCLPAGRFAFITQESKPNTLDISTEEWVNSENRFCLTIDELEVVKNVCGRLASNQ